MSTALILLAAGQGTRMKSDLPKVLHPIAGAPMLVHALRAGAGLKPDHKIVIAGHGADAVRAVVAEHDPDAQVVIQDRQNGTGDAVAQARPLLEGYRGDAIVLYGDTPFISADTLARMTEARARYDVVVLGFEAADPGRYGRLVMKGETLERIVEFKDADDVTRSVTFCNSGVVAAPATLLFDLIAETDNNNASGEYYLTDIVQIARDRGLSATAVACDEAETLGINSRSELAGAELAFQQRMRARMLEDGVSMPAPETVHFAFDTDVGRDTVIEQHVVFGPGVRIGPGARIRAFSHLEGARVSQGAIVGPYARLRPGTELAAETRIGNFVEIKSAVIEEGTKVNHLSYIGDARLGARTNIGAGTVTCNYDGVSKHRTEVGRDVFIGSDTMLVAPVSVGNGAMTASGSVITRDVPEGALAIARAEQVVKPGMAKKLLDMFRSGQAKRRKGSQ